MSRKFHPWEGGEGKATGQYVLIHLELAKILIKKGEFEKALTHLKTTETYPRSLGEGKLHGAKENDIFYWKGVAFEGLNKKAEAKKAFEIAAEGKVDLTISMYYNDQQPDKIFYQALALEKLGKSKEAEQIFRRFVEYGEAHKNDKMKVDYFAVSLPDLTVWEDDLDRRNRVHCLYLKGLGLVGLKDFLAAREVLKEVLDLENMHSGASVALNFT